MYYKEVKRKKFVTLPSFYPSSPQCNEEGSFGIESISSTNHSCTADEYAMYMIVNLHSLEKKKKTQNNNNNNLWLCVCVQYKLPGKCNPSNLLIFSSQQFLNCVIYEVIANQGFSYISL